MKKLLAIAALLVLSSTAWAHHEHFGGNGDMYQSPLMDHGPGGATGKVQKGQGDLYASHLENPEDVRSNPNVKPEPYDYKNAWKTEGDQYQSVIFENEK